MPRPRLRAYVLVVAPTAFVALAHPCVCAGARVCVVFALVCARACRRLGLRRDVHSYPPCVINRPPSPTNTHGCLPPPPRGTAVGVTELSDRKKLFELVTRVREAAKKTQGEDGSAAAGPPSGHSDAHGHHGHSHSVSALPPSGSVTAPPASVTPSVPAAARPAPITAPGHHHSQVRRAAGRVATVYPEGRHGDG
jgi:hypothetical protein